VLKQRFITAIILAPLVLCGVFLFEPVQFSWFFALIIMLAAWEWANLSTLSSQIYRVIFAAVIGASLFLVVDKISVLWMLTISVVWWAIATFLVLSYPDSKELWRSTWVRCVLGFVVLLPMWKALVFIREASFLPVAGLSPLWIILYMLLLVWIADTGAYFAGKTWGKSKLAPSVSPGKSWAGAWGGVAATTLLAIVASFLIGLSSGMVVQLVIVTFITTAVSIIGDLTESMFKRQRGIKDSSNLLPGHGGVLDRIDSLVAAIPVFVFSLVSLGWVA